MNSIPVICYHAVRAGPGPLCLPPSTFARHVALLAEMGCVSLTMDQVADHVSTGRPFPERAVALTFDDGYESVHRTALPLLDEAGFVATVYPVTSQLGGVSLWNATAELTLPLLAPTQVTELREAGWEVGGHTHHHHPLAGLARSETEHEIARSNGILEDLLQVPVRTFAYPFGSHDAQARSVVAAAYRLGADIGAARARLGSRLDRLERIEAWYLRRDWQVRHLHDRVGTGYLAVRRAGRRVGRLVP